jgi:hypothetical protein
MELDIAGQAIIKNVNMRAEHHGEDRELGVDLKLELRTNADVLANLSTELKDMLWLEDDTTRRLRVPELKPLKLDVCFENHTLHLADLSYDGVTVHKFEVDPEPDGAVNLTMTVSMSKVQETVLPPLAAALLDHVVNIDIEPMQAGLELVVAAA